MPIEFRIREGGIFNKINRGLEMKNREETRNYFILFLCVYGVIQCSTNVLSLSQGIQLNNLHIDLLWHRINEWYRVHRSWLL